MRTTAHPPSSGPRRRALLAALACALAGPALPAAAATFTVSTSADFGTGTLRQAILDANAACPSASTVVFSGGPFVIAPSSPLPEITCATDIQGDGSVLSGTLMYGGATVCTGGFGYDAALCASAPATVSNLEIANFSYGSTFALSGPISAYGNKLHDNFGGIQVTDGAVTIGSAASPNRIGANSVGIRVGSGSAAIDHNFIGTSDGTSALANGVGIDLANGNTLTDGPNSVTNNVVSGNTFQGITVEDLGASTLSGNMIGTTAAGDAPLGNENGIIAWAPATITNNVLSGNLINGVNLYAGGDVSGNRIGTDATGTFGVGNNGSGVLAEGTSANIANNVISGNGIGVEVFAANNVQVTGNRIGTDDAGASAIANNIGVLVTCTAAPEILGNTVSGNDAMGVGLLGVTGGGLKNLSGNVIGMASDRTTPLGNLGDGVVLDNGGSCILGLAAPAAGKLASLGDTVGVHIDGDIIAHNGSTGIRVASAVQNAFTGNSIYGNGRKNIDLQPVGSLTPDASLVNDPGDTDTGPNEGQNYPIITDIVRSGGSSIVTYTLDSAPGTYQVEFFSNPGPGLPAGKSSLGTDTVTIASGALTQSTTLPGAPDNLSMTATLTSGSALLDTSEFSPIFTFVGTPAVSVTPPSVGFGTVPVGSTSPVQNITVSSVGTAPYPLGVVSGSSACDSTPACGSGAFICSTTCVPGALAIGASCLVSAQFAPTAAGSGQSTSLFVCASDGSSTPVTLTGDAVLPAQLRIVPDAWDFGSVAVGQSTNPHAFAVVNTGGDAVTIGAPQVSGSFEIASTTCGSSVAAAERCAVEVRFVSRRPGPAAGTLTIPLTGAVLPVAGKATAPVATSVTATLAGTGVVQAQLEVVSSVDFGSYTLGAPSLVRTVALRNAGNADLAISGITVDGPFAMTHDCPASLAPGATCSLTISFVPPSEGPYAGTVGIASDAPGGLRTIALSGLAQLSPAPVIHVSPVSIGFGGRVIGDQSPTQRITITNAGGAPAALAAPAVDSLDFLVVGTTCGVQLAPQSSCVADVALRPIGLGPRSGTFGIGSNAEGSPHTVQLSGAGCSPFAPGNRLGSNARCGP